MHTWCIQSCLIADTYQGRAKNVWIIDWKTLILHSCLGLSSNWLWVKITKFSFRTTFKSSHQTYLFQLMAASQNDFKPICSFTLNHSLIRKQSSNQSKVFLSFFIYKHNNFKSHLHSILSTIHCVINEIFYLDLIQIMASKRNFRKTAK